MADHGCIQTLPDINHSLGKGDTFRVIYDVEGYLADDTGQLAENLERQSLGGDFMVSDIETTRFNPKENKIIEVDAVKMVNGKIAGRFPVFVSPDVSIPFGIEKLVDTDDVMMLPRPKADMILP